ncbi:RNA-binding protein [Chitinophaga parva]|uniref:RNA-binding protein n=1 Tax=Chitinophaga parva TaxID=2169414 RepID=A0A2T7BIP1_9BACT|nr:RNA-binding protein [Chitinophaga parva]PUZ26157.1 RNA-binding protein [Chitinophaga parva]
MRLRVSNLNRLTTVSHLVDLFVPFGLISFVRIAMNRYNGDSVGIALVEIDHEAGVNAIASLHNLLFMNRYIQVEETVPNV